MNAPPSGSDPSSWPALDTQLDALLGMDADERLAALADLARRDPAAADALSGWLAAIEQSEGFLEPMPLHGAPAPGLSVGAWRLVRRLGRGGMGDVWLAERADGAFTMRAAIKFIRDDRAGLHERLVRERHVLARLDHPRIARLLDGGVDADGRPYLVTEFVDGVALDRWCIERAPPLASRLAVFRAVAQAVAYAHANLVVHRDLKAANVLVDAYDRPKLLDFGIATLVAADGAHDATEYALTPDSAAPEQLTGAPITTRTDVYALGALLYRLLAGVSPLAVRDLPIAELVRRVCDDVPVMPSRAGAHAAGVPPRERSADLDAIALKALAKAPEDRYATVEAMLADLDNAASMRPVAARRATAGYRARRFLRRNRYAVAIAATLAAIVVLGVAGTLWQARVAAAERERAEAELASALVEMDSTDAADEFLITLIGSDDDQATHDAVQSVIARGLRYIDGAHAVDASFRAAILGRLAGLAKQAGDTKTMGELYARLRTDYVDVMPLRQRVYATCSMAWSAFYRGSSATGRRLADEGAALAENLRGSARGALAFCLGSQAAYAERSGDIAAALALAARAVEEARRLPPSTRARAQQIRLPAIHAAITLRSGDVHGALAELEPLREPAAAVGLPDVVSLVHNNLADAYDVAGRPADAERSYEAALAVLHGSGRNLTLGFALVRLARVKNVLEKPHDARRLIERANAILSDLVGERATMIGHAALELARADLQLAEYARAEQELDLADANYRDSVGPRSEFRVHPALVRARIALARGKLDAAQAHVDAVRAQLRAMRIDGPVASCDTLTAEIALRRGDAAGAEAAARRALERRRVRPGPDDWRTADDEALLARVLVAQGRHVEAAALLDHAVPRLAQALGATHTRTRNAAATQAAITGGVPATVVQRDGAVPAR